MDKLNFISAALALIPLLVAAGEDVAEFANWAVGASQGEIVTQADVDALHEKEKALRAKLEPPE